MLPPSTTYGAITNFIGIREIIVALPFAIHKRLIEQICTKQHVILSKKEEEGTIIVKKMIRVVGIINKHEQFSYQG